MTQQTLILGTDTDVGKTYIAGLLAKSLLALHGKGSVGVYKPVASGCVIDEQGTRVSGDALALWQAAGCPLELNDVSPQRFLAAVSPPRAAEAEQKSIDIDQIYRGLEVWTSRFSHVIIEGAGGLLSPLADGLLNADFAASINTSFVLVAANRLGVINHTLSAIEVCRSRLNRLPLAIVFSQTTEQPCLSVATNASELASYVSDIPIIRIGHAQPDFASSPNAQALLAQM